MGLNLKTINRDRYQQPWRFMRNKIKHNEIYKTFVIHNLKILIKVRNG